MARRKHYEVETTVARSLRTDELEKLTNHARHLLQTGTKHQRRDVLAVLLGLSGLRIQEVCNLNRNDLREDSEGRYWLRVRTLKGGRRRDVPIEPSLADQLRSLRHRKSSGPMLEVDSGRRLSTRNLRRSWHAIRVAASIDPARFHDLRHTAAMAAWEQSGHNLFVVSTLLGHAKIENTRIYLATAGALTKAVIPLNLPPVRAATQLGQTTLTDDTDGSQGDTENAS